MERLYMLSLLVNLACGQGYSTTEVTCSIPVVQQTNGEVGRPGKRGPTGPVGPVGPRGPKGEPCSEVGPQLSEISSRLNVLEADLMHLRGKHFHHYLFVVQHFQNNLSYVIMPKIKKLDFF